MGDNTTTSTRIPEAELHQAVTRVRKYFDTFKNIYVGRERVIELFLYAMLQKSHLLFFGVPGTAKSAIAESVFRGIDNAPEFSIQMSAFTSEDAVFGPINLRTLKEEGTQIHNVEKMLPTATFAALDEILDANPAVLRSMLSVLNERKFIKGRQILDVPLHLAYCSTNIDPYQFMKRNPQAWAVFDRINFLDRISYLDKAEDIAEMVKRFQYKTSAFSTERIDFSDIQAICDYILFPPTLIQDKLIFMKYGEAVDMYRKKRKEKMQELEKASQEKESRGESTENHFDGIIFSEISDRRICWASHMMEVNAVLDGRTKVEPKDMYAAHFVLGTSETEKLIWEEIIATKIEEIKTLRKNEVSTMQADLLEHFREQLETMKRNTDDPETQANGIATLLKQINEIIPDNDQVTTIHQTLKVDAEKFKEEAVDAFLKSKNFK